MNSRSTQVMITRAARSAFVAGAMSMAAVPAFALSEGEDSYGNHFVSGGVSTGELREMHERKSDHRLSLVTASMRGAHLAGVHVRLIDGAGNLALETEMDGPWLLAALPPGTYQLEAEFDGEVRRQQIEVPIAATEPVYVHFRTGDRVSSDLPDKRLRAG